MLASLELAGVAQLPHMRADQVCAVLRGLARLGHAPSEAWRREALAAAEVLAPSLEAGQVAELLQVQLVYSGGGGRGVMPCSYTCW